MAEDGEHRAETDDASRPADPSVTHRRTMLKRIGVGAAVVWTVPAITTAKALAASSGGPAPCPICGQELIVNGNADGATVDPWDMFGPGTLSIAPYDQSFVAPIPAADPNYFLITIDDTMGSTTAEQFGIPVPTACVGSTVDFSGFVAVTGGGTITPEVCYYDSNGSNIDHVDAATVGASTMTAFSGSGVIPPDTATIAMQFNVDNVADVDMTAMFDFVSVVISCT